MFAAPARALGDCPVPLTELNMCGIIGILNLEQGPASDPAVLRSMLGMIRHRGPDEYGIYRDADVGLGNARLSIIDLSGGSQPSPRAAIPCGPSPW